MQTCKTANANNPVRYGTVSLPETRQVRTIRYGIVYINNVFCVEQRYSSYVSLADANLRMHVSNSIVPNNDS